MHYWDQLKQFNIDNQSYLLLRAGLKPVIRLSYPDNNENINNLNMFCKKIGLFLFFKKYNKLYGGKLKTPVINIYISSSSKLAKKAYEAEIIGDRELLGELLGYPKCCVKSFVDNFSKNKDFTILTYKNTHNKPSFFCNNIFVFDSKLGPGNTKEVFSKNNLFFKKTKDLFLINHVPCSFNCKKSIKIGKKTLSLLKKERPKFATKIINAIKKSFLYFDYFNWVVFDGTLKDDKLFYKQVLPYQSFMKSKEINKIKSGNKIKVTKKKVCVFKNNQLIHEIIKKNEDNGIIINF